MRREVYRARDFHLGPLMVTVSLTRQAGPTRSEQIDERARAMLGPHTVWEIAERAREPFWPDYALSALNRFGPYGLWLYVRSYPVRSDVFPLLRHREHRRVSDALFLIYKNERSVIASTPVG